MRLEMRLAERKDRREEFLAKLEREKVDLERERLRMTLGKSPDTHRTTRDILDFRSQYRFPRLQ